MWRLLDLVVEGYTTGFDGFKPVQPLLIGAGAAEAGELWIKGHGALVGGMIIAPVRVGLPDLDQGIGYAHTIAVNHMPLDADTLTSRFRPGQHIAPRPLI